MAQQMVDKAPARSQNRRVETPFNRLGEEKLRAIIDAFVDRVMDDVMIGFFFRHVNRERLKELEYQHAAEFLEADVKYRGRALRDAHGKHPIMGGHGLTVGEAPPVTVMPLIAATVPVPTISTCERPAASISVVAAPWPTIAVCPFTWSAPRVSA